MAKLSHPSRQTRWTAASREAYHVSRSFVARSAESLCKEICLDLYCRAVLDAHPKVKIIEHLVQHPDTDALRPGQVTKSLRIAFRYSLDRLHVVYSATDDKAVWKDLLQQHLDRNGLASSSVRERLRLSFRRRASCARLLRASPRQWEASARRR